MFDEYLKDMRIKTIRILILLFIFTSFGWYSSDYLITYFISLSNYQLITTEPFEMLNIRFTISILTGFLLSSPFIYIESYRFISPALYQRERKILLLSTLPVFGMILIGFTFALRIFIPAVLKYLDMFYVAGVNNTVAMNSYISFILTSLIVFGVIFCLPIFLSILGYVGLINYKTLQKYHRHAILGILIFGAVITPDPFIFTCLLVSVPLILLYELSTVMIYILMKKSDKHEIRTKA